jgi:hypothetical protein
MSDEKLTNDEAEALLKKLSRHFREPVLPMRRYCDGLRTWADCIVELNAPGRTFGRDYGEESYKFGASYAGDLAHILRDISKSSLLARILYGGERLRTRPCPEHQGKWSGIGSCPYGCGDTGWIQEPEDRPTKQQLVDAIAAIEARRAQSLERWGKEYDTGFHDRELVNCRAMLAYLYPDTPGTGIEAPFEPEHHLVFYFGVTHDSGRPRRSFRARLDVDPRTRSGQEDGHTLREVPLSALTASVALIRDVIAHLAVSDPLYSETHVSPAEKLAPYAIESGRHGIMIAVGGDFLQVSKSAASKSVQADVKSVRSFVDGKGITGVKISVLYANEVT